MRASSLKQALPLHNLPFTSRPKIATSCLIFCQLHQGLEMAQERERRVFAGAFDECSSAYCGDWLNW